MGIAHDTILQFRKRIDGFRPKYIQDWIAWMGTPTADRARELKRILGKWQACRGNTLRSAAAEGHALHSPPYLCDLLARAQYHVNTLQSFDLRSNGSYTKQACDALRALWEIFEDLSYARSNPDRKRPPPRKGKAGVVGISKATLLITEGRVGPAFDSRVRRKMGIRRISNAEEWLSALRRATTDIAAFERRNHVTLEAAAELSLPPGRIYDMALGPS